MNARVLGVWLPEQILIERSTSAVHFSAAGFLYWRCLDSPYKHTI